jgi:hypothetical protein
MKIRTALQPFRAQFKHCAIYMVSTGGARELPPGKPHTFLPGLVVTLENGDRDHTEILFEPEDNDVQLDILITALTEIRAAQRARVERAESEDDDEE